MMGYVAGEMKKQDSSLVNTGLLQRKTCACGRPLTAGGECAECRKKRLALQRRAVNHDESRHSILQPPPVADTRIKDPRNGMQVDFSHVKARTGGGKTPPSFIEDPRKRSEKVPSLSPGLLPVPAFIPGPILGAIMCAVICDQAYRDPSLNSSGGGVICNGAIKCPCVFDVPPTTRGQCAALDRIVMNHEVKHLGDVDCDPSQGLHRPPFRNPAQATAIECTHRRASIAELDTAIASASEPCLTHMTTIRSRLNTWVTANCGGGGGGGAGSGSGGSAGRSGNGT